MEGDVEPEIPRSQITWPHINWKSRLCRRNHDKVEFHYSHSVVMGSVERVMRHVALKLHDLGWYLISDYKNPGKERSSNRSKSLTQISLHRHLATLTFRQKSHRVSIHLRPSQFRKLILPQRNISQIRRYIFFLNLASRLSCSQATCDLSLFHKVSYAEFTRPDVFITQNSKLIENGFPSATRTSTQGIA